MKTVSQGAVARARQAYFQFRGNGEVPAGVLPAVIEASWKRCHSLGVSEDRRAEPCPCTAIDSEQAKNETLIKYAVPAMEALYEQIVDSHSTVILTNPNGLILRSLGDADFLDRARRIALTPGVEWSEEQRGTNAIGLAAAEQRPVVVHGPQHFFAANHFLTCSASPIFDPLGKMLGVLDVTGDHRSYSPHSLALVRLSVRMVENKMFMHAFPEGLVLHFHTRHEFLGTLNEGLLAFTADGRTCAANAAAATQLDMPAREIGGSTFEDLFRQPIRAVLDHILLKKTEPLRLIARNGNWVCAYVTAGPGMKTPLRVFTYPRAEECGGGEAASAARPAAANPRAGRALEKLDTGDAAIHLVIAKVRRVLGRDIPILIHGETGAGKELLAQAIHDDGPRHDRPFVAVNCAAIPEGLIESELFGYDEGAFTGAKRKGSTGRIMQANGGTLFLDEIGDMPMPLQARLLRVLQERVVTPLGSTKSFPVDIHLVCATHRRLKDWVAAGKFREDLYYRLNGLTVNLPPLRDRTDLGALVGLILSREAPAGEAPRVADEVMEMFRRHRWPGNIRQLSNLLRTALVMAADDSEIAIEHLPDDFLEEFDLVVPPAADAAPTGIPSAHAPATPMAGIAGAATAAINLAGDLEAVTLNLIQRTLEQHCGNVSAAARQLGVSRNTLYRKLRQIWQL